MYFPEPVSGHAEWSSGFRPKSPKVLAMITFACPKCGKAFSVPDEAVGKRGKCKACGEMCIVPAQALSAPPALEHHERTPTGDAVLDALPVVKDKAVAGAKATGAAALVASKVTGAAGVVAFGFARRTVIESVKFIGTVAKKSVASPPALPQPQPVVPPPYVQPPGQPYFMPPQNITQTVIVQAAPAAPIGNPTSTVALVFSALAFSVCWIPFLGLMTIPIAALAGLLGILGLILGLTRKGSGAAVAMIAIMVSCVSVMLAMGSTAATVKGISSGLKSLEPVPQPEAPSPAANDDAAPAANQ